MTEGGAGIGNAVEDDLHFVSSFCFTSIGKSLHHHRPMPANQTAAIENLLTRLS